MIDATGTPPSADQLRAVIDNAETAAQDALDSGNVDDARRVLSELVKIDPDNAVALNGLGVLALRDEDFATAERLLRGATKAAPRWADPHHNLGVLLLSQGRTRRALQFINKALEILPGDPELLYSRSQANIALGRGSDAEADLRAVVAGDENHATAWNDLGVILTQKGALTEAADTFRRAVQCAGATVDAWVNLGNALLMTDDVEGADAAFREAEAMAPAHAGVLVGLAASARRRGDLDGALAVAERALGAAPDDDAVINLVGTVKRELGDLKGAGDCFQKALALNPRAASARANLGLLQLLEGDWRNGFENFEARRADPSFSLPWGGVNLPEWDGGDPAGQKLIVFSEQGFGDSIQFARFLPSLCERGAEVFFAVQPELARLMESLDDRVTIIHPGDSAPALDKQILLLSLPHRLGLGDASEIAGAPYLHADPDPSFADVEPGTFKVGLAWQGARAHKEDFKRSLAAEALAPILDLDNVSFVSLLPGNTDLNGHGVASIDGRVSDFADTARLIATLDLVISVDTASAHLAGALGVPCWTLVPHVPDWRWGPSGDTTVWYDSMRLYRQPALGDWESVVRRVADDLRKKAA